MGFFRYADWGIPSKMISGWNPDSPQDLDWLTIHSHVDSRTIRRQASCTSELRHPAGTRHERRTPESLHTNPTSSGMHLISCRKPRSEGCSTWTERCVSPGQSCKMSEGNEANLPLAAIQAFKSRTASSGNLHGSNLR